MIGPERRAFTLLLGALMMVNALSIDMVLPALPALSLSLHATPESVQLSLSLYLVGYAVAQLFCGPLSDRFGRRPLVLGGLAAYALASLACGLSRRIDLLIALRVLQGIAACGGPVIVRAIVRDHFAGARAAQMLSALTSVFALAPFLAPVAGGALLVRWGWPAIFYVIAAWSAVLVLVAWWTLGESLRVPDLEALRLARILANTRTFVTTRAALGFAFVNGLCWVGIFAFLSGSPFVFIEYYGVAPDRYGFYFGLSASTLVAGAFTNRRLLRRHPGHRVMRLGFAILALGGALVLLVPLTRWSSPLAIMGGVMVYMFGQTLVQPNAVAAALDPLKHMAGMGSAFLGTIQMLCGAAGGVAVGWFFDNTPRPMGAMMLFAALASGALYAATLRKTASA